MKMREEEEEHPLPVSQGKQFLSPSPTPTHPPKKVASARSTSLSTCEAEVERKREKSGILCHHHGREQHASNHKGRCVPKKKSHFLHSFLRKFRPVRAARTSMSKVCEKALHKMSNCERKDRNVVHMCERAARVIDRKKFFFSFFRLQDFLSC